MSSRPWDVRLRRVTWQPVPTNVSVRTRVRILALLGLPLAVWYFGWLLNPERIGTPYLYGLLIAAEIFNLIQAFGFWWTCCNERVLWGSRSCAVRIAATIPGCLTEKCTPKKRRYWSVAAAIRHWRRSRRAPETTRLR